MNMIERLHNCPNCGGTLQDDGACRFCGSKVYDFVACRFCGSKVYDFVGINLDDFSPTYIRMKYYGNIIITPVRFTHFCIESSHSNILETFLTGTLEFVAIGDTIVEDTKVTGGE